jgi:hypothetical protein
MREYLNLSQKLMDELARMKIAMVGLAVFAACAPIDEDGGASLTSVPSARSLRFGTSPSRASLSLGRVDSAASLSPQGGAAAGVAAA